MSSPRFGAGFVDELSEILSSEAEGVAYDAMGKAIPVVRSFTGEWNLRSIEIVPGSGRTRVSCRFYAEDRAVVATIDAADFPDLVGKQSRDAAFNLTQYSDLAFITSMLIQEQILTHSPSTLAAHQVRIRLPEDRTDES